MEHSILSLQSLPFLLPMVVCAIILNVGLYAHLHFKHVPIKNISIIAALAMLPFAAFFTSVIATMAFDFKISLMPIYIAFAGICFSCLLVFSSVTPKRKPSVIQIIGVGIFIFAFYSLLA